MNRLNSSPKEKKKNNNSFSGEFEPLITNLTKQKVS